MSLFHACDESDERVGTRQVEDVSAVTIASFFKEEKRNDIEDTVELEINFKSLVRFKG